MKTCTLFLTFFCLIFSFQNTFACDCHVDGTFCETLGIGSGKLVVKGKKIAQIEHGMDFEISNVYFGVPDSNVIRIWGDPGFLCRVYLNQFEIGEELILILNKVNVTHEPVPPGFPELALEEIGDYYLNACGVYFLRTSDEKALSDALTCLGENTAACDFPDLKILPNVTSDFAKITFPVSLINQPGSIQVINSAGQIVFEHSDIQKIYENSEMTLNFSELPRGVYYTRLYVPNLCPEPRIGRIVVN